MRRLAASAAAPSLLPLLALLVFIWGCGTPPERVTVVGPTEWSALGLAFTLPEGIWEVQRFGPSAGVITLSDRQGGGEMALFRSERRAEAPGWLLLHELLAEFRSKKELKAWAARSADGREWNCGLFLIEEERHVPTAACATQADGVAYRLVVWGRKGTPEALQEFLDGVVRSARILGRNDAEKR